MSLFTKFIVSKVAISEWIEMRPIVINFKKTMPLQLQQNKTDAAAAAPAWFKILKANCKSNE